MYRLTAKRGRASTAVRLMVAAVCAASCLVAMATPLASGAYAAESTAANLIDNGDFESGATSWSSGTVWNASAASISVESNDVHGGSQALKVTERTSTDAGAKQSLSGKVAKGGEYSASMWIKSTQDANFNFTICSGNGSGCAQIATGAVNANVWTEIKGSTTLESGDADFTDPSLVIETVWNSGKLGDYVVDDVSLTSVPKESVVRPTGTAVAAKKIGSSNPIIDYWYGADPWAMEYNGRVYVYTTGDATSINSDGTIDYDYEYDANGNIKDNSFDRVQTLNILSSDDMVNWRNEGYVRAAGKNGVAQWASHSWAPAAAHKTINGKEKFFLYFADGGSGIGVLTSDSPVGPWTDGGKIVSWGTQASQGVVWLFDPAVFVDDDGTGYLYYGGGVPDGEKEHPDTARVIQLGDDMTSTVGDAKTIDAPAMFEDSGIAKIGDTYYYSYCTNFSHDNEIDGKTVGYGNIAYMTSDSPMGPFTYQGEIMQNPSTFFGVGGNNHHAMVQLGSSWYMVYHAQTVAKELTNGGNLDQARGYRNTHIDPITINANGSIAPITMTYEGLDQVKNLDAYQTGGIPASTIAWDSGIQDAYDSSSGVRVVDLTTDNSKGQKLSNINDGEWTSLSNVDFGAKGAESMTVNAAGRAGGTIEVRLDSNDSAPIAVVDVDASDGASYKDYTVQLSSVSGTHNVFFTFKAAATATAKSSSGDNPMLFDIKTYTFTEADGQQPETVDKSELRQLINRYLTLKQSDYTASSWRNFSTALDAAKKVLNSGEVTKDEVDKAVLTLKTARGALHKIDSSASNGSAGGSSSADNLNAVKSNSQTLSGVTDLASTGVGGIFVAIISAVALAVVSILAFVRSRHI